MSNKLKLCVSYNQEVLVTIKGGTFEQFLWLQCNTLISFESASLAENLNSVNSPNSVQLGAKINFSTKPSKSKIFL